MRRLKVLYVIGTLDIGGTERQLVALATRLDRTRFEPVVCCLASGDTLIDRLRGDGIRVEVIGLRKQTASGSSTVAHLARTSGRLAHFVRFVRRERPDIVHGLLFWGYVLGTFAAKAAGVRAIVAGRRSLANFKTGKPHYVWMERLTNRWTDRFIANAEAVRAQVISLERVAPERVSVIYNGLDADLYTRLPPVGLRASLAIPDDAALVTVVANFIHYKGHLVFLDAWKRVLARHPRAVAMLIGEGPMRDAIEARARELGVYESLRLTGHRHDVPDLLAITTVCAHPSFEEGFSNAVIEAMAAGKPVVATDVGGTSEAVMPGRTGWLVPPRDAGALADALIDALDRPDEAGNRGREARQLVADRFDLSAVAKRYEEIYEQLGNAGHS